MEILLDKIYLSYMHTIKRKMYLLNDDGSMVDFHDKHSVI